VQIHEHFFTTPITLHRNIIQCILFQSYSKMNGLLHKFKSEIIDIEIFDLYKLIHLSNKELIFAWPFHAIKKHHSISFNNLKHRLSLTYQKKFKWILTKTNNEIRNNIKLICYSYHSINNKYSLTYKKYKIRIQKKIFPLIYNQI